MSPSTSPAAVLPASSSDPNYRRVAGSEPGGGATERMEDSTARPAAVAPAPPRTLAERLADKAWAAAWVVTAAATAYWTDTRRVLLGGSDAVSFLLQLVAVGVGVQTVLVLYLTVYLPYGKGLTDSSAWSVYCPRVIPVLTATAVVSCLLLLRAVWPVWGFLAPLILSVEGLGLLFALHFVPSW